ncbi:hypothetical protein MKW98_014208, partial [Papaver atlanticum]
KLFTRLYCQFQKFTICTHMKSPQQLQIRHSNNYPLDACWQTLEHGRSPGNWINFSLLLVN